MKKKIVLVGLVGAMVVFISGCSIGSKKLVCTQNTNGVDVKFNVGFKNNVVNSMDFSYEMDLSSYSDSQISLLKSQDFCSYVKSSMSQYKDAFQDCEHKVENKKLNLKAKINVDKIADGFVSKIKDPDKAKKELETEGYSCKFE